MPWTTRSSVDLPAPFGPTIPMRAPSEICRSTPRSTGQEAKDFSTPTRLTTLTAAGRPSAQGRQRLGNRVGRLDAVPRPADAAVGTDEERRAPDAGGRVATANAFAPDAPCLGHRVI